MKTTCLSIPIVFTLHGSPRASRANVPPSRHRTPRNLKGKRITNRAQTKVAFRLPRKHDTSNP